MVFLIEIMNNLQFSFKSWNCIIFCTETFFLELLLMISSIKEGPTFASTELNNLFQQKMIFIFKYFRIRINLKISTTILSLQNHPESPYPLLDIELK